MTEFHNLLLVIITLIAVFVLLLLLYVMYRFSEKRNPTPSRTTHNTVLEVLWTTIPVIILVIIAIPSFKLLYYVDRVEDADMTIKERLSPASNSPAPAPAATGHQTACSRSSTTSNHRRTRRVMPTQNQQTPTDQGIRRQESA